MVATEDYSYDLTLSCIWNEMEHFKIENDTDLDDLERFISEGHDSRHSENNNDYDLLQQAIISNNSMAVSFILMKDVISPNEHPSCNDYLHLACKLGRASMVKKIVEVSFWCF